MKLDLSHLYMIPYIFFVQYNLLPDASISLLLVSPRLLNKKKNSDLINLQNMFNCHINKMTEALTICITK